MADSYIYLDGSKVAVNTVTSAGETFAVLKTQAVDAAGAIATPATLLADNADGVAVSGTANSQKVASRGYIFNGTSWDRERKTNLLARVASSAAAGNPAVGKASAGDVRGFWGENAAIKTYLQIYNKASAPVIGTDTPVMSYPIPANAVFSQTLGAGVYCPLGIGYAFTTDAAGTTAAAAAAVLAFSLMMS